ncbi:ABC transporter substrate binding protein [Neptunomonas sp. CHC150]|jgi:ABC-type uncharacterized transport system substrate-binding protein|uniref:ABC transporter substrate-binding protein n=1 Tax=Neptunomonas TaxID=75687 RepID=UPI0009489BD4|nr:MULTISPECIES: ABC transporter substrate binding protein [Neptunomonas]MDN2658863.1 ABC transporter substrate binding protein [Neptunomonas sp. CHC150]
MLSFKKLIIFLAVFLSVNVFAEQLIDKKQKINKPWVLGYFEGGPYSDYKKILTETVTAMMNDGLLEQKRIPAFSGEQTAELWTWLAENLSNSMITFSKDFYFSADWDEKKREKYQVEATELLINKEVDLLIAMGTWAGQSFANNQHNIPTIVMSASDPISSNIVRSIEDSGYDHVHATIDPERYQRQITLFHEVIGFKRLGIAYEDTVEGRSYAALDIVLQKAEQLNFDVIPCFTLSDISDSNKANMSVIDCFNELSKKTDAIYVTVQGGVNRETLPTLVEIVNKNKIPTFSQSGVDEVKKGMLLSLSQAGFKYVGDFQADVIKRVISGESPREISQLFEEPPRMAVNIKSAEIIGFNPPLILLGLADEIFHTIEGSR